MCVCVCVLFTRVCVEVSSNTNGNKMSLKTNTTTEKQLLVVVKRKKKREKEKKTLDMSQRKSLLMAAGQTKEGDKLRRQHTRMTLQRRSHFHQQGEEFKGNAFGCQMFALA